MDSFVEMLLGNRLSIDFEKDYLWGESASFITLNDSALMGAFYEPIHEPEVCKKYLKKDIYAAKLVDSIVTKRVAERDIYIPHQPSPTPVEDLHPKIDISMWPTVEMMNVDVGADTIREYINRMNFKENWQFNIFFLRDTESPLCSEYQYEVIFSLPTNEYPIVQAYASVFFFIQASKLKRTDCKVEVYYCYENMRLSRNAKIDKFQEFWLNLILDCKINFFKTLRF
ncbi:uncharacterized protein LOC109596193 [Aethina tumida]|uniref:uncharacterized protein LOC109596193 n=1 Tax=Aethina tumida TaxID=116153 RepID=UPI00096B5D63|nr:uncharacterized protein LOC109596193 [Aethina tumida]